MSANLPPGFTLRRPTMADVEAATDLHNARALADIGTGNMSVSYLTSSWQEPGHDLETDDWLVFAFDGRMAGSLEFKGFNPFTTLEFDQSVHPDFEGQGIEESFIALAEERAGLTMSKAPADEKVVIQTSIWLANEPMQRTLAKLGYERVRIRNRMQIEMDAPPDVPPLPQGISLRHYVSGQDDAAIHQAWEEAQGDEWGHATLTHEEFMYDLVEREKNFDPTLWLFAIDDASGEIAGYILCRWERPGEPEAGHVRDIGVRSAWRQRGIAASLLGHSFAEFQGRGKGKVSLSVDSTSLTGADRLYERVGMRAIQRSLIYEKELRPTACASE